MSASTVLDLAAVGAALVAALLFIVWKFFLRRPPAPKVHVGGALAKAMQRDRANRKAR